MTTPSRAPDRRIYLDNAATSFPKPPGVAEALRRFVEELGASAGRGAYREAVEAQRLLAQLRAALRTLLGARPEDHVIFTLNGTDALNFAIKSLVRPRAHVVTSVMDHNSVLRPLSALQRRIGVEWTAVQVDPRTTRIDPQAVADALRPETALVVLSHASNVTGVIQPLEAVGRLCRERSVPFAVDAAQSAGHVPIEFARGPFDLLAAPGHKGLLGPLGTGVLLVRAGLEDRLDTVREGGTGSASELPLQPDALPDKFEAGSHNLVGLAGLLVAVRWLLERGVAALRAHEMELSRRFHERLAATPDVRRYGPCDAAERVGVFSVSVDGQSPTELSALLETQFGVLTRSGLHCAPLAHRTIGTLDAGGTTRLSFGPFTTADDVDAAADALAQCACELATARR